MVSASRRTGQGHFRNEIGSDVVPGEAVERDLTETVKWWTFAAEQGNSEAQFDLAQLYPWGRKTLPFRAGI
jgi:hypothetical protein